ncbi:zinc finger BED domain-containing protein 5-like [Oopsacas minuta]|uniref:Zinc finger BED domain-containing protein 5-like n=1 Tax=Oopsacas minuta TaxID=111878 RepID=A0AAV7JFI7_9METZ|nr:zinc finger BED domain-containing protein 5-like [Oopsacas minuta]
MLGEDDVKKLAPLSISNNTVHRRIVDMSEDVKLQVISEMITAPLGLFSIQLDESTDVASCAQLICFTRYIHDGDFKEDSLLPTIRNNKKRN